MGKRYLRVKINQEVDQERAVNSNLKKRKRRNL